MEIKQFQQSIKTPVSFTGIGLHTGQDVTIHCLPAPPNTGICFRRMDLVNQPVIQATAKNIVSTRRCTSIGSVEEGWAIHTIEHLMAAIAMSGIDNLLIEMNSSEPPVTDGSAVVFMDLLRKAGVLQQNAPKKIIQIQEPIYVKENDTTLVVLPYDGVRISYTLVYDHPVIGTQYADYEISEDVFYQEIAPARTFGFAHEIEALHQKGLALGGSLDNAVLVNETGTVNSLRFPNEFVRHKVLDLVGDLAVNGTVKGHFIGIKSGHSLNAELSRLIFLQGRQENVRY